LRGAGHWTHQYGDATNANVSSDRLVRVPLGLLWFGGPSNRAVLPRHGHGPRPQVAGGRLFVEGADSLRALDVYTGRLLWQAALPGVGMPYDSTSHQPGANAIGSNYVSSPDAVWVVHGDRCLRLDAATGKETARIAWQDDERTRRYTGWGYLALADELLVAGASRLEFSRPQFEARELSAVEDDDLDDILDALHELDGVALPGRLLLEWKSGHVTRSLNRALAEVRLWDRLPLDVRQAATSARVRMLRSEIDACLESASAGRHRRLTELNRELLRRCYPKLKIPASRAGMRGASDVIDGTATRALVAIDAGGASGAPRVRWAREARHAFRHNAICVGGGKVFAIDRLPRAVESRLGRRGEKPRAGRAVIAIDARTGDIAWVDRDDVFGTFLSYSSEHDILLQSGRPSRDMLDDEAARRFAACRGATGEPLWARDGRFGGPCMLWHDTIITQGSAYSLLSGEKKTRPHPLTDEPIPWTFSRHYGCNTAIASEHLLTFRSAAAGFFDLERLGGTGSLGGFRSSCTQNLIVADGVLVSPDYTRTCECSYQNQSSIALVHMPGLELWTFNNIELGPGRIRRVGINFGAPGDRRAGDGTLWLESPVVGGPSPGIRVDVEPRSPRTFRVHSSRVDGEGHRWVGSSGVVGVRRVRVWMREIDELDPADAERALTSRSFTVRLSFVEPDGATPGDRVFHVALQGARVLDHLDVRAASGGAWRQIVREFRSVSIDDTLDIELAPTTPVKGSEPVLCGVVIIAE